MSTLQSIDPATGAVVGEVPITPVDAIAGIEQQIPRAGVMILRNRTERGSVGPVCRDLDDVRQVNVVKRACVGGGLPFVDGDNCRINRHGRLVVFADNRDDLAKVDAPCLILQHRNDALVPLEVGEYTHKNLKNSTYEILDVTGHCAHMSHPQLVISAMENYLHGA